MLHTAPRHDAIDEPTNSATNRSSRACGISMTRRSGSLAGSLRFGSSRQLLDHDALLRINEGQTPRVRSALARLLEHGIPLTHVTGGRHLLKDLLEQGDGLARSSTAVTCLVRPMDRPAGISSSLRAIASGEVWTDC